MAVGFNGQIRKATPFSLDSACGCAAGGVGQGGVRTTVDSPAGESPRREEERREKGEKERREEGGKGRREKRRGF